MIKNKEDKSYENKTNKLILQKIKLDKMNMENLKAKKMNLTQKQKGMTKEEQESITKPIIEDIEEYKKTILKIYLKKYHKIEKKQKQKI